MKECVPQWGSFINGCDCNQKHWNTWAEGALSNVWISVKMSGTVTLPRPPWCLCIFKEFGVVWAYSQTFVKEKTQSTTNSVIQRIVSAWGLGFNFRVPLKYLIILLSPRSSVMEISSASLSALHQAQQPEGYLYHSCLISREHFRALDLGLWQGKVLDGWAQMGLIWLVVTGNIQSCFLMGAAGQLCLGLPTARPPSPAEIPLISVWLSFA